MSVSKTNPPGNKMPRGWNKILYPGWKNIKLYVTSHPAPRTWVTEGVCIHLHYHLWTYHPIDLLRDLLVYITSHQRLGLGVPFNVFYPWYRFCSRQLKFYFPDGLVFGMHKKWLNYFFLWERETMSPHRVDMGTNVWVSELRSVTRYFFWFENFFPHKSSDCCVTKNLLSVWFLKKIYKT